MSKHTPGPWHVNAIAKGRIIGDETAEGAEKLQICNSNATVATVYRPKDARLIAYAPDLLAACQEAVESVRGLGTVLIRQRLRAAIAKATGDT